MWLAPHLSNFGLFKDLLLLTAMTFMPGCADYVHKRISKHQAGEFIQNHQAEWPVHLQALEDPARFSDRTAAQKETLSEVESVATRAAQIKFLMKAVVVLVFSWLAVVLNRKLA